MESVIYVSDTSAVMRFFQSAAGGARMDFLLSKSLSGRCRALISALDWGELHLAYTRKFGADVATELQVLRTASHLQVVPANRHPSGACGHAATAARIGYADCFGIERTMDSPHPILVTSGFGAKPAESLIRIEFLPAKPTA